jgi:hypothetical protein
VRNNVSTAHIPRGMVLHLLDELRHEGASREFWDRYWRLAPRLRPEDLELVRRVAEQPAIKAQRAPLHI